MKIELFAQILAIVAQITELSPEQILYKTRTDDLVAARSLFVHYCASLGVPSISIARFMQRSGTHSVGRYLADYNSFSKSSYIFRQMDVRIAVRIGHRSRLRRLHSARNSRKERRSGTSI